MSIQAIHLSRSPQYREPGGAVAGGTMLRLALRVNESKPAVYSVVLCYAYGLKDFRESKIRLKPGSGNGDDQSGGYVGHCLLRLPLEACLFFYWFELETDDGRQYLCADRDHVQGGGQISGHRPHYLPGEARSPAPWQITVYDMNFSVPNWLPGSVIYQIFPDRFNRDTGFDEARFRQNDFHERIWHKDWFEDVDFRGKPETGYLACDFFGGSLAGIREKLDYIHSLGVTVLSLNPIFKARSNHRYDTGDYELIDPLLGDENEFRRLCEEAGHKGIRIILDGVFSHTGADSRYFNKLGRYPGKGAWQDAVGQGASQFGSWYVFHRQGDQLYYDSWWGFPDLPAVNEHDLDYRNYIVGPEGIVRRWLRLGASGWRLDVSDEMPDDFLRCLRRASRAEKADAIVLGEVCEDASAKISYGSYRDFLLGRTHDMVMGYVFQNALIGWLSGHFDAGRLHALLAALQENYPTVSFYSSYNMISGHDIPRAMTALAGKPDPGNREAQSKIFLTAEEREKGEKLLRLAVLFQMTWPGCPVIYYGDETAMEGYRDPFNRRTFPWGKENRSMQAWYRRLGKLHSKHAVLRTGKLEILNASGDCILFRRYLDGHIDVFGRHQEGPAEIILGLNRSCESRLITTDKLQILLEGYGYFLSVDGKAIRLTQARERRADSSG